MAAALYLLLATCGISYALPTTPANQSLPYTDIEPRQDYDAQTKLTWYGTTCDTPGDKDIVVQAWKDALMFANGVDDPNGINFNQWLERDYYGKPSDGDTKDPSEYQNQVRANWQRFHDVAGHWSSGDWWYERYVTFACRNQADIGMADAETHCIQTQNEIPAHTVRQVIAQASPFSSKKVQYIVVLCDNFFDAPDTQSTIAKVDANQNVYPLNNVKTMISQGSHMLHEMLHIGYKPTKNEEGFTFPRDIDKVTLKGKAYGPERAKYLARQEGLGVAFQNVDNNVFYAVARWMKTKWGQDVTLPKFAWRGTAYLPADDGFPDDTWGDGAYSDFSNSEDDAEYQLENETPTIDPAAYVAGDENDWYGGNTCSVDDDCDGVCLPGVVSYCDQDDKTCRCGFKYNPISA